MTVLSIKEELITLLEEVLDAEECIETIDDANEAYIVGQQYAYAKLLFFMVDGVTREEFDGDDVQELLERA
ncbi:hypothetical protein FP74_gp249 [Bacillus phage CAM003]|uniref:Uncharacterized protein n=2 Tax=Bastillevirus TaxID=1918010 RepID=A0A024B341_9CAUD|nr:hypothetical protein FP73_gp230 [Bacillus phage Hoody T]YP_009037013.1 hypothetical protein FP74_gp249 [Bacillus phage CAM003]AHZ09547.1 hypothetical protein [Bacillus phage CAM003]AHZ10423.1 hypothetical protein [Bacillus phage Hoody T]